MQRRQDEVKDGLPNPHGGGQEVEEHAREQAEFDIPPRAPNEHSDSLSRETTCSSITRKPAREWMHAF